MRLNPKVYQLAEGPEFYSCYATKADYLLD